MEIGDSIRIYRKKAGLSQKELAHLSGLSETVINNYENGRRKPKLETIVKIASALHTEVYCLLDPCEKNINEFIFNLSETYKGFTAYLAAAGYSVTYYSQDVYGSEDEIIKKVFEHELDRSQLQNIFEARNDDNKTIVAVNSGYELTKDNQTIRISAEEFTRLAIEFKDYLDFRVQRYFDND